MSAVNPYGFYEYDWHMLLQQAVYNMALPGALYATEKYALSMSGRYPLQLLQMTAGLWAPLLVLGLFTEIGMSGGVAGFYIEHILSNFAPILYLGGIALFVNGILDNNAAYDWLITIVYAVSAYVLDYFLSFRGTFAMYWLNPRAMTLDAQLFPSLMYMLGLRTHRYRYYYHYPEYAPDFDI